MTVADRLNQLIKILGIRKIDLARKIGITSSSVSTMFSGKSNPSRQTITAICRAYGVNEAWLSKGEGEMFIKRRDQEEVNTFIGDLIHGGEDSFKFKFVSALSRFDDNDWNTLEKLFRGI